MNNEKILSIIIATWNTRKQTEECIESILNLPEYSDNTEIILVDNASRDNTSKSVTEKYPEVKLIENDTNKGYAPACNQGIRESTGKYVLLLGSDTLLLPGSLSKLIEFLEVRPDVYGAGIKLMYPDGRLQSSCKKFPTLYNAFLVYLSLNRFNSEYDMRNFGYDETLEVEQVATTYLMMRGDVLRKLGGFDERFRIMYNDVDLCKRIYKEGGKIYFFHEAGIYHHGCLSTNKADFKLRKIMYEDIYRYYRENHGAGAILLAPVLKTRLMLTKLFKKS